MTRVSKPSCSLGTEFQYVDLSSSKPDCAEKVSNFLLKPLRLACGREVKVQLANTDPFQNKKQLHIIARIFLALVALIILPFTLMGLAIAACSKSHKEMRKRYSAPPMTPPGSQPPSPSSSGALSPAKTSKSGGSIDREKNTDLDQHYAALKKFEIEQNLAEAREKGLSEIAEILEREQKKHPEYTGANSPLSSSSSSSSSLPKILPKKEQELQTLINEGQYNEAFEKINAFATQFERNNYLRSTIFYAARVGNLEFVRLCGTKGLNDTCKYGSLLVAVRYNKPNVVGYLLSLCKAGDLESGEENFLADLLQHAADKGFEACGKLLYQHASSNTMKEQFQQFASGSTGASSSSSSGGAAQALTITTLMSTILRASESGDMEAIRKLFESAPDCDKPAMKEAILSRLSEAAEGNDPKLLKFCMKIIHTFIWTGNDRQKTHEEMIECLNEAVGAGHLNIVQLMVEEYITDWMKDGSDVRTLLKTAKKRRRIPCGQYLVRIFKDSGAPKLSTEKLFKRYPQFFGTENLNYESKS